MFDYRKLLETPCSDCIIDVVGWKSFDPDRPQAGEVNIGLISGYDYHRFKTWRGKLERIVLVLKGESYPALFFYQREDVDAFIGSLQEATDVAFAGSLGESGTPQTTVPASIREVGAGGAI